MKKILCVFAIILLWTACKNNDFSQNQFISTDDFVGEYKLLTEKDVREERHYITNPDKGEDDEYIFADTTIYQHITLKSYMFIKRIPNTDSLVIENIVFDTIYACFAKCNSLLVDNSYRAHLYDGLVYYGYGVTEREWAVPLNMDLHLWVARPDSHSDIKIVDNKLVWKTETEMQARSSILTPNGSTSSVRYCTSLNTAEKMQYYEEW